MRPVCAVLTTVLGVLAAFVLSSPPASAATSYVFVANGDGTSWTDPANWSPAGVPGTGDAVLVQAPSDDFCRAHLNGIPTGLRLADLTVDEHLYRGDADSPCLTSLDGGSITVTHALTFHAGTIDSPLTVPAGATATVTPGAAHDTTHFGGAVTVDGTLTVTGTTDPENLSLTGGPGITVDAGGTFVASGDNHLTADCCGSPAHLTNRGTVQAGAGTLTLDGVELDQDALLTAAGGTVVSLVAPQTAGNGAQWTGTGAWRLGRSTVTTVTGTQTLSSGFTWQYGGSGSTAQEHLHGTFALAGTGSFAWAGGEIDAAMTTGTGVRVVASGAAGDDGRAISGHDGSAPVAVTVQGAATFSGGAGWYSYDTGTLVVASTGTLTLGAGTRLGADTGSAAVVNQGGKVVVPAKAGTVTLTNTGYRATGGTLTVGTGADLEVSGVSPSSLSTTTVTGGGVLGIATTVATAGTITTGTATTLRLAPGSALTTTGTATATVTGAGTFAWTGGAVTGRLTVTTAGGQKVSGATEKDLLVPTGAAATVLTLGGPTTISAGSSTTPDLIAGQASSNLVLNGATTIAANTRVTGAAVTNAGAMTVAASTGRARIDTGATLRNRGTLTVATGTLSTDATVRQTAGTTTVAAGATLATTTLSVTGGALTGGGQVAGAVSMTAATLDPSGTLSVTRSLATTSATTVHLDLAATVHDQVAVTGAASVLGTLVLADATGYQPAAGDVVTVLTASTLTLAPTCVTTTGDASTAQHWSATRAATGKALQLTSVAGPAASC